MSNTVLVTALLPVFFVLLLGYAAGRYHRFSPDQATGFNQLATNFAMPASLFSDMVQLTGQRRRAHSPLGWVARLRCPVRCGAAGRQPACNS